MTPQTLQKEMVKTETKDLRSLIEKSSKELARALPAHMRPERLVRIALTCIRTNPELSKCTPESFLGALFVSAQLGIEPVAGLAYILPFNNKKKIGDQWTTVKEAQFVLGYKGLGSLFYRHEKAVQLSWGIVHKNDDFEYEYGTSEKLRHKPALNDAGPVIAYYVVAKLANGGTPFMVMSKTDCIEHGKKHSKTYDKQSGKFYASSPWATAEDSMCLKTVLIQLGKLLPLSVEIQRAIQADETSRDYRKGIDDALDLPTTTNFQDAEVVEKTEESAPETTEAKTLPSTFRIEGVALTEIDQKDAWIIRFSGIDTKYYTQDKSITDYATTAAKNGYAVEISTEKKGQRTFVTEIRKV